MIHRVVVPIEPFESVAKINVHVRSIGGDRKYLQKTFCSFLKAIAGSQHAAEVVMHFPCIRVAAKGFTD